MSAMAGINGDVGWHIGGIALHGVCYTFYFITAQVFLDRRVEPGLRGQAQGLLVMVSSGVGPLVGAVVCGYLRAQCVTEAGQGWAEFWAILAGMIAVCFVIFALFYQGRSEEAHTGAENDYLKITGQDRSQFLEAPDKDDVAVIPRIDGPAAHNPFPTVVRHRLQG
jgi:MFS family permease